MSLNTRQGIKIRQYVIFFRFSLGLLRLLNGTVTVIAYGYNHGLRCKYRKILYDFYGYTTVIAVIVLFCGNFRSFTG